MTRLSITLDPMPALRQAAEDRFDAAFNAMAAQVSHVDAAHAQKRLWAATNDPRLEAGSGSARHDCRGAVRSHSHQARRARRARSPARRAQASHQGGRHAARIGRDQAMTKFPSYAVGTVSIDAGATVVAGAGGPLWTSTTNVRPGDDLVVAGHIVIIEDVIDDGHLEIDAWSFPAVPAGTPYKIVQRSPLRFSGAEASADVIKLVARAEYRGAAVYRPARRRRAGSVARRGKPIRDPAVDVQALAQDRRRVGVPGPLQGSPRPGCLGLRPPPTKPTMSSRAMAPPTSRRRQTRTSPAKSADRVALCSRRRATERTATRAITACHGIDGIDGAGYGATSATSLLIRRGLQTFATQAGACLIAPARGSRVSSGANYMEGLVTAYADESHDDQRRTRSAALAPSPIGTSTLRAILARRLGAQQRFQFVAAAGQTAFERLTISTAAGSP